MSSIFIKVLGSRFLFRVTQLVKEYIKTLSLKCVIWKSLKHFLTEVGNKEMSEKICSELRRDLKGVRTQSRHVEFV